MNLVTFVFINFIVSFMSDILLNDLASTKQNYIRHQIIDSLRDYFKNKTIIYSAILAGITIVLVLIGTMLLSRLIFGFYNPTTLHQLLLFIIIAFPLGYIADIFIDYFKVFGSTLNKYYKIAGAGFYGAFAFIVSVCLSYIIQKNLLPIL